MPSCKIFSVAWVAVLSLAPAMVSAQTGPALLLKPLLSKDEFLEARAEAMEFDKGRTDRSFGGGGAGDDDFRLSLYRTSGRLREQRENFIPRVGWDFNLYRLHTDARLPRELMDSSVAIGLELPTVSGWRGGLTVGVGYAGDKPFGEGDAWYGKATAIFGKDLDKYTTVAIVLDYDGSRPILPDVPLPGIAYVHQYDPTLSYTIGFPLNSVRWRPSQVPNLTVEVNYLFWDTFTGFVDYEVVEHLVLFARVEADTRAFHVEQIPGNDRLLFEQRRAEIGVRFRPWEEAQITAAVGYAWGGSFDRGFDYRDTDHITDISDEPYLRVGFETRF
ncbi:MAG TPA: hypothetical protein VF669_09115 [Tepidisphaeraceae bacterium]|jgi:hypothetical protein